MKAFLLLVAIFLFSHQAVTVTGQSDPANIACFQSGGSCRPLCRFPAEQSGDCAGGLVCCIWVEMLPVRTGSPDLVAMEVGGSENQ